MFQKKLFLLNLVIAFLCFANGAFAQKRIKGEGTVVKQNREVGAFTKISLEANGNAKLVQGATQKIEIEGYANIIDVLEIVVESNTLKIRQKKLPGMRYYDYDANNLKITITNPTFELIDLSGSFNVEAPNKITTTNTEIRVSGSGNINLESFSAVSAKVNVTGSGNIDIKGNTDNLDILISGSGDINLFNFVARTTNARISGSGSINCNATEKYDLKISGSGFIKYKKTNATVNSKSSGSGNIESVN